MNKSIFLNLIIFFIGATSMLAQNEVRLDSIRIKTTSFIGSDTMYSGSDFTYVGNTLKVLTVYRIIDGVKDTSIQNIYNIGYGNYQPCNEVYVSGNLNRYICNFDTLVNGKVGLCTKVFQTNGSSFNLVMFNINFKSFDNNDNLIVDSTLVFNGNDMTLIRTLISCFNYDDKNNVVLLIKKTQEGPNTSIVDVTEYEITYNSQGMKETEIVRWINNSIPRKIDSLVYTYVDEKIIEHSYNLFSSSSSPVSELTVTTRNNRGFLNIKEFSRDPASGGVFQNRNVDYYYSKISSTTDTKYNLQTIYPNPTSQYINIDAQITSAAIFHINGQKVIDVHQPVNGQIDVSELPSGVYLLEPTVGNVKLAPYKFVKY